jgi:predicted phosphodiesterase
MWVVRVHVVSDLHLERGVRELPMPDADVVVLAGDISTGTRGVEWAREWSDGRPVLYVAGNHEYYGQSLPGLIQDLRAAAAGSAVRVLEDDEAVIDGVRFLGCTLWSDFEFDGPESRELSMRVCERAVSDYRVIRRGDEDRPITPADTLDLHFRSRAWLEERLATAFAGPTVVITHHAPYVRWRPPKRALRLLAGAFVSDLAAMMGSGRVPLWIYGHTHRVADLEIAGTRIVSNPCGYPNEAVEGYDPALVVEIDGDVAEPAAPARSVG